MKIPVIMGDNYFPNPRTRATIHREAHQSEILQHRHSFFEIAVICGGSGVHVTDGFRHRLQAGDVLLIHSGRKHGYERTRQLSLFNVLIRNDVLQRIGQEMKDLPAFSLLFSTGNEEPEAAVARKSGNTYPNRLRLTMSELEQMEDLASRIEEESGRAQDGGFLLAEAYLTLMVGLLVRSYERNRHATPERHEGRFGRVLGWIETHLAKPLQVIDMARQAGMSERTFHRRFRTTLGVTPLEYLLQARVRRAKEQLSAEDSRIAEVAQSCGFEDSNYFARCFRAKTGQSPREFRRRALAA